MTLNGKVVLVTGSAQGIGRGIALRLARDGADICLVDMQLECTVREFAKGFRVHPAFCETVVDAARDAAGWALYLPKRG